METLAAAIFLATANYAIVNYLKDPVALRFPKLDLWWMVYVSFVTGAVLSWVAGIDLFGAYIPNPLASQLVTALVVGGGSNLIYQVFGKS